MIGHMTDHSIENLPDLCDAVAGIAQQAGAAIMDIYSSEFDVDAKADNSPLTAADLAAHKHISSALAELTPDIPQISEEGGLPEYSERSQWPRYWLIDPLDGTREFVSRNGEFTVNIALIDQHRSLMGVVYVPVSGVTYTGIVGHGALRYETGSAVRPIRVSEACGEAVRVVGSRSHRGNSLDAWLESRGDVEFVPCGSSLKFCLIAEGKADVYPRFGPTSEWDTAAAQAVAEAAGGRVVKLDGSPLAYNTKESMLNPYFMVSGPNDQDWLDGVPEA